MVTGANRVFEHAGREFHIQVEDLTAGIDSTQFTVTELFGSRGHDQPLEWTGNVPVRSMVAFDDAGIDVLDLLRGGGGHA